MDIETILKVFKFLDVEWEEIEINDEVVKIECNLELARDWSYNKEIEIYFNTKTNKAIKHYEKITEIKETIARLTEELKILEKDN